MSQPDAPKAPNAAKSYQGGIDVFLSNLPRLLAAEDSSRASEDPNRILEQQSLQAQFGPTQYQQQLDALHQLDPAGSIIRDQLGGAVSSDLASGYSLPPELKTAIENNIRGAQVAHGGSTLGSAPTSAEAAVGAQKMVDYYQQHLDNAGQFLGLATPEQQIQSIAPVSPDRTSSYANPNSGYAGQQFALANYGNQLTAAQSNGNPWSRALSGAATGAAAGSAAGGWGSLIGGVAGGVGGYFSSEKLKHNIVKVGEKNGLDIVEFSYNKGSSGRYRGVIAEHVQKLYPEAVGMRDGFLTVHYDKIGIPFEKKCPACEQFLDIETGFYDRPYGVHKKKADCKECSKAKNKDFRDRNPEYVERSRLMSLHHSRTHKRERRAYKLRVKYGISIEEFEKLNAAQNGLCGICGQTGGPKGLVVDHCHKEGTVRGLLCVRCNWALGFLNDDPSLFANAICYLTAKGAVVYAS